jgi:hypothetical protein
MKIITLTKINYIHFKEIIIKNKVIFKLSIIAYNNLILISYQYRTILIFNIIKIIINMIVSNLIA